MGGLHPHSAICPPLQLSVVTRAASSMQWPDSPSGSGTPSGRSWKGLGFLDATAAAGSPKSGSATPGGAASDGFSPAIDTAPLEQPEAALQQALAALQAAAASQRSELDWQAQYEALRTAARLARHHPELLAPSLHALVLLAAPVVDALRSTLSRLAILLFQVGEKWGFKLKWHSVWHTSRPALGCNSG